MLDVTDVLLFAVSYKLLADTRRLKIGFVLRYNLNDDVRQSLYDACTEWGNALGNRRFLGGEKPNLADLVCTYYNKCFEIFVVML